MRALKITKNITRRDQQSLEKYFTEIARHDLLTPEEETDLFRRFQKGEDVLNKIIEGNLRFVVSVAKQYQNMGLPLGDLINEGNLGLIKAAQRFDTSRGFKFISYAVWWIRQTILQAINDKARKIRTPLNVQTDMNKVMRAYREILQKEERAPRVDELAERANISVNSVDLCMKMYKKTTSLDASIGTDSDASLSYFIEDELIDSPDHNLVVTESGRIDLKTMLSTLSKRQSEVLTLHFGIDAEHPMHLSDIAEQIGVTRERVRQIKNRGILTLQRRFHKTKSAVL